MCGFCVSLPFKEHPPALFGSLKIADQKLYSLEHRLTKNPTFHQLFYARLLGCRPHATFERCSFYFTVILYSMSRGLPKIRVSVLYFMHPQRIIVRIHPMTFLIFNQKRHSLNFTSVLLTHFCFYL